MFVTFICLEYFDMYCRGLANFAFDLRLFLKLFLNDA